MNKPNCPFTLGEIAVFESWMRFEKYISRVMQIHIDNYGNGGMPRMTKATLEQKQLWWDSGEYEVVIDDLRNPPPIQLKNLKNPE